MFGLFKQKEEIRSYSASIVGSVFDDLTINDAMTIPAVYSAVSTICSTVASVVIEDAPKQFDREPQENITRYNWLNVIVKNILLEGNAYAEISGNELKLLNPKDISAFYDVNMQTIVYYQHMEKRIYPERILHFKGLTKDNLGQFGYSALTNFSNSFSRIQAMSEYEGNYMINASRPSLWIETVKNLSKDAIAEIKASFQGQYQGTKNSGKIPIMANGMQLHELKQINTLVDADLVALKQASLKEIAMIFNIPVSKLDNSLATYSNAVEANLNFLKLTINPLLTNIKEEINLKLNCNMSFDTSSLIEGSFDQKINTLTSAVSGGILTANEARKRLNYDTKKDGDILFNPAGTPTTNKGEANAM